MDVNQSVLETELTSFCAATFLQGRGASARDFMVLLQPNTIGDISGLLSAILADEVEAGNVSLTPVSPGVPLPTRFQSILGMRQREDNKIDSIALFALKDTATSSALPLLGVAIAVSTLTPLGAIVPTIELVRQLWRGLRYLKRPRDSEAIDVIEAILEYRVEASVGGSAPYPTVRSLAERVGRGVYSVVKTLLKNGIIEVHSWGNQRDDLDNPDNTLMIRL